MSNNRCSAYRKQLRSNSIRIKSESLAAPAAAIGRLVVGNVDLAGLARLEHDILLLILGLDASPAL
jgi:hypothetical protein